MSYKIGYEARQYKKERDLYKKHALRLAKAIRHLSKQWERNLTAPMAYAVDVLNDFEVSTVDAILGETAKETKDDYVSPNIMRNAIAEKEQQNNDTV